MIRFWDVIGTSHIITQGSVRKDGLHTRPKDVWEKG